MLRLDKIINTLHVFLPNIILHNNTDVSFSDTHLIIEKQKDFSENILYVGYTSTLCESINIKPNTTLLLINNCNMHYENLMKCNINIIEFSSTTDIFNIFNKIKNMFTNNLQFLNNSSELYNIFLHTKGLQDIIETVSKIIQNPLIVLDANYKVLGYSKNHLTQDEQWLENITRGYCTYEYINAINNMEIFKNSPNNNKPFTTKCFTSPYRRMFSKFFIDCKITGYILTIESNKTFTEKDMDFLKLASSTIAKEIQYSANIAFQGGNSYGGIFIDLLEGNISNEIVFSERIKGTVFDLTTSFQLMTLNIDDYKNHNIQSGHLKHSIEKILPCIYSIYHMETVIVLIDMNNLYKLPTETYNSLNEFFEKNLLVAGFSDIFTDLYKLPLYYSQSKKTLDFCKNSNSNDHIFYYDDYKYYDLISYAIKSHNPLNYCWSTILKIKTYDEKNSTDYLNTLFEYLNCNKSISKAAEKLFIHKNTVSYRINKLKAIFEINLNNSFQEFQIYYSYLLLNYIANDSQSK